MVNSGMIANNKYRIFEAADMKILTGGGEFHQLDIESRSLDPLLLFGKRSQVLSTGSQLPRTKVRSL